MLKQLKALQSLTAASMKMYFRNVAGVFFTLFIPIFLVVIFGYLTAGNNGPTLNIGITNRSKTEIGTKFVEQVKQVKAFKVEESDLDTLRDKLGKGKIDLQVIVPVGFGQTDAKGRVVPSELFAYYNQARPQTGQAAVMILNQIVGGLNGAILRTPQVITLNSQGVATNNLGSIDFLLPGIISMSIMQLGIFSVAFGFISFKTTGALRRLQVAPVRPSRFILAQTITRLIIAVVQVCILVVLGIALFHLHLIGSLWELMAVAILGALVFLAFGFFVAGVAKDENQAAPLSNLIGFPQIFLAGVFFPRDGFPHWLKTITDYMPLTYLSDAMRRVANEGATLGQLQHDLLGLAVWGVVSFFLAVRFFSWE